MCEVIGIVPLLDFEGLVECRVETERTVGIAELRHVLSLSEVTGVKRSGTGGI